MNIRSASGKANPIVGVVAVIAIIAAGWFILQQSRRGPAGGDPSEFVVVCAECGGQVGMDGATYAAALAESRGGICIQCPDCGKESARTGTQCINPECGAYYLRPGPDGRGSANCPKCGTGRPTAD